MAKKSTGENLFVFTHDGAIVDKMIDDIIHRAGDLQGHMHVALVSAGLHFMSSGDTSKLQRLVNGNGLAYQRPAMLKWAKHFLPINWKVEKDDNDVSYAKITKDKKRFGEAELIYTGDREQFIASLDAIPFFKFMPAKLFNGFDLKARIAALIKEAEAYEAGTAKAMQSDTWDEERDAPKVKLAGLIPLKQAFAAV